MYIVGEPGTPHSYFISESDANGLIDFIRQNTQVLPALRERLYTVKDIPETTHRLINHWESQGLLEDQRVDPGCGWRKFSLMEMILVRTYNELRKFNMSLTLLANAKHSLQQNFCCDPNVSVLEATYLRAMARDIGNIYLVIQSDGTAWSMSLTDVSICDAFGKMPAHYLLINVNKMLHDFVGIDMHKESMMTLTHAETELIFNMRSIRNKATFCVKTDNSGTPNILEIEQRGEKQTFNNLHTLIDDMNYGKIELDIKDGTVCNIMHKKSYKVHK